MKHLPVLQPGDHIEIIAPASRCSDGLLSEINSLLSSWHLNCTVSDDIFGPDLLCANTDEIRFESLKRALLNPDTKAILCARGGYGCMRLIPELEKITPPTTPKLFIGMSDITALNLFLQQKWHWPVIHGALALDKFSPAAIDDIKALMFGNDEQIQFQGIPLNAAAKKSHTIQSSVTGGNLCLIQTSIGTSWQLNGRDKIILLEEIGERGYRVDRMLAHLEQAGIFKDATAILLGDFIGGEEADGQSLVQPVLERFAAQCALPVVQVKGIGHGRDNLAIPLGTSATLQLGSEIKLICFR